MNSKSIAVAVIALVLGGAAGFFGGRATQGGVSQADIQDVASMMAKDGSAMQDMGKQMAEQGRMMREKNPSDAESVKTGQDMEASGIKMEKKGKDMIGHGDDLKAGMMPAGE